MRKAVKNALRALGSCAVLALMAYAPQKLPEYIARDEYMSFFELKQSEWKGVLEVWNIEDGGVKLPQEIINSAKKRYSRQNIGVYIEYSTLSPEKAADAEQSKAADIWIFPASANVDKAAQTAFRVKLPGQSVDEAGFEFDIGEQMGESLGETTEFCVWTNTTEPQRAKYIGEFAALIAKTAADVLK